MMGPLSDMNGNKSNNILLKVTSCKTVTHVGWG